MENEMKIIEEALRGGGRLHAFMSGGGLRVLRVERDGVLVGYGEHPTVNNALRILSEDIAAGSRPYADVYGKIEPHYLTGSSAPGGALDAWVRQGQTFDAFVDGDAFVVKLCGWENHKTPDDIMARVLSGETVQYLDARGVAFESRPSRFPNGEACVSTRCLDETKKGADPWMWEVEKLGRAPSLPDALDAALVAPAAAVSP